MFYEVYDNGKPADHLHQDVCDSWEHPDCETFEEAQRYCKEWLGNYSSLCPTEPNKVIDYSGAGDTIEIRKIK